MDEFGQLHRLVKKPGSNVPLELINNLLLFKNANNEMHNYNSDLIKNYNVAIQLGIMTGYKGTETDINNINRLKFELAINSIFDEKYVVKNNLPINEILTKRLSSAKDFEIEQKIMQNQRQFMQEKTQYIEKQNILIECAIKTNLLEFKNNEIKKNVYFPAHIKDVYGQYQWYNGLMIGFSVADLICNILSITML
jgi:hypothetical protein